MWNEISEKSRIDHGHRLGIERCGWLSAVAPKVFSKLKTVRQRDLELQASLECIISPHLNIKERKENTARKVWLASTLWCGLRSGANFPFYRKS